VVPEAGEDEGTDDHEADGVFEEAVREIWSVMWSL
jgi:hypothetical protein